MSEYVLKKLLKELQLECPICWEEIDNSNVICTNCCKSIYHKNCLSIGECQVCEDSNPIKIDNSINIIKILLNKSNSDISHIISSLCQHDIILARRIDNDLRTSISLSDYIRFFKGVYPPPNKCRFTDDYNTTSPYKPNENVLCSLYDFFIRWDEFSHGLFTDFNWPKNCVLAGLTVPALLGKLNYNYAYETNTPIHFIVFDKSYSAIIFTIQQIIAYLKKTLDGFSDITYAVRKNYLYIKIPGIVRTIRIEVMHTQHTDLFRILTNYTLSGYEMCQSYFDGKNIFMTLKAIVTFAHQITYRKTSKTASYHYNDATGLKFEVNYAGVNTRNLPQIYMDKLNYSDLDMHVKMLDPTLTLEINKSDTLMYFYKDILNKVNKATHIDVSILPSTKNSRIKFYISFSDRIVNYNHLDFSPTKLINFVNKHYNHKEK